MQVVHLNCIFTPITKTLEIFTRVIVYIYHNSITIDMKSTCFLVYTPPSNIPSIYNLLRHRRIHTAPQMKSTCFIVYRSLHLKSKRLNVYIHKYKCILHTHLMNTHTRFGVDCHIRTVPLSGVVHAYGGDTRTTSPGLYVCVCTGVSVCA